MIRPVKSCIALSVGTLSAALMLGQTAAAQPDGRPGWRIVFSRHYPRQSNALSGYEAVAVTGRHSAWVFGGTNIDGGIVGPAGGRPVAESWNGRAWSARVLPARLYSLIVAASASSAANVWAVSFFGGYALHWNGARWSTHRFKGELTGVTAISPGDVWVFGASLPFQGAGTWHLRNGRWHKVAGVGSMIDTASAVSAHDIWAIGGRSVMNGGLLRYDGRSWRAARAPALVGFSSEAIVALARHDVWVAGGKSVSGKFTHELLHWNGTTWHAEPLPSRTIIGQITSDGHGGLWLIAHDYSADKTWMMHRSAAGRWTRTFLPGGPQSIVDVAKLPGTTSLLGAGLVTSATNTTAVIWAFGKVG